MKRKELLARIRDNHAALFSKPELVGEIQQQYHGYHMRSPFLNLSSKKQYAALREDSAVIIAKEIAQDANSMYPSFLSRLDAMLEVLLVSTSKNNEREKSSKPRRGSYYRLPDFLDPYCWPDFTINLIKTRFPKFTAIFNSEMAYGWLQRIGKETSTPILNILDDSLGRCAELSGEYDQFIDVHMVRTENAASHLKETFGVSAKKICVVGESFPDNADAFARILQGLAAS